GPRSSLVLHRPPPGEGHRGVGGTRGAGAGSPGEWPIRTHAPGGSLIAMRGVLQVVSSTPGREVPDEPRYRRADTARPAGHPRVRAPPCPGPGLLPPPADAAPCGPPPAPAVRGQGGRGVPRGRSPPDPKVARAPGAPRLRKAQRRPQGRRRSHLLRL